MGDEEIVGKKPNRNGRKLTLEVRAHQELINLILSP